MPSSHRASGGTYAGAYARQPCEGVSTCADCTTTDTTCITCAPPTHHRATTNATTNAAAAAAARAHEAAGS